MTSPSIMALLKPSSLQRCIRVLGSVRASSSPLSTSTTHYKGNEGTRKFKKAADIEAKINSKEKKEFKPIKAKQVEISIEDTMTPEQLERWLAKKPVDDVWITKYYPEKVYDIDTIVKMHRQVNHPTMLDNPDGDVFVTLSLNMAGVKQTKPLKAFSVLTHLPHLSEHTTIAPRDIAVLVKNPELQMQLEAKGATFIGGEELIAKLKAGTISKDADFDYLLAHMDIVKELSQLRKKYLGMLPSEKEGTLGVNIHEMFDLHRHGYSFQVKIDPQDPFKGSVAFSLGKLSFTMDQMMENLNVYLKILRKKRPANLTPKRGSFITEAVVKCPPNDEVFKWNFDQLNEFIDSGEESLEESDIELKKMLKAMNLD